MKIIFAILILIISIKSSAQGISGYKEWIAPESANSLVNPFIGNEAAAAKEGRKIYFKLCFVCHGDYGKGDGAAGAALNPKPRNFTLEKTQSQTDGTFFWKITEGRPPMASYRDILTVNQRWQLVNFLRTFKK